MADPKRKSLLFTLDAGQVDDLIVDKELLESSSEFHYIIDTHDIIHYCFPLGWDTEEFEYDHTSAYLLADKQVAMSYFFRENSGRIYFIKEYYNELRSLKEKLLNTYNGFKQALQMEVNRLEKAMESTWKMDDLIGENLSVYTAVGIIARGGSVNFNRVLQRYVILEDSINAVQPPGFLDTVTSENDPLLKIIYSQFSYAIDRSHEFYVKQYETYLKKNPHLSDSGFYSFVDDQKRIERHNALFDSLAIKRVFDLNQRYESFFLEKKIDKRIVFVYLSSAPRSYKVMQKLANKWPIINGKPFNPQRNAAQMFAHLILKQFEKTDYNHFHTLVTNFFEITNKELLSEIENERNRFENYSLLREYKSFLNDDGDEINVNLFRTSTKEYLRSMKNKITEKIDEVEQNTALINQTWINLDLYDNLNAMINARSSNFNTRRFELDPIGGVKQQLPCVFDYRDITDVSLKQVLKEISYFYCLRAPTPSEIDSFREALLEFTRISSPEANTTKLVMFILGLIVPLPATVKSDQNTVTLNHITTVLQSFESELFSEANTSDGFDRVYTRELKYVQVWAARRGRHYARGLELTDKYILMYPDDPRFYHSKCLTLCSWNIEYYRNEQVNKREGKLHTQNIKPPGTFQHAIEAAETAIRLYGEFVKADVVEARNSIESLHNMIAQLNLQMCDMVEDDESFYQHLEKGKYHFARLCELAKTELRKYQEYRTTELMVELMESNRLLKQHPIPVEEASAKLSICRELLEKLRVNVENESSRKSLESITRRVDQAFILLQSSISRNAEMRSGE